MIAKIKGIFPYLVFVLLMVLVFFPIVGMPVKQVNCSLDQSHCPPDVLSSVGFIIGKTPFEIISEDEKILQIPIVSTYDKSFVFPDTLLLKLVSKKPTIAYSKVNDTDDVWFALADLEGNVVLISESTSLPIIKSDISLSNPGEKIDSRLQFVYELLKDDLSRGYVREVIVYEDHAEFFAEGIRFTIPTSGEVNSVGGAYLLVLNWLNTKDKDTRIIKAGESYEVDLRYKNPVIKVI